MLCESDMAASSDRMLVENTLHDQLLVENTSSDRVLVENTESDEIFSIPASGDGGSQDSCILTPSYTTDVVSNEK